MVVGWGEEPRYRHDTHDTHETDRKLTFAPIRERTDNVALVGARRDNLLALRTRLRAWDTDAVNVTRTTRVKELPRRALRAGPARVVLRGRAFAGLVQARAARWTAELALRVLQDRTLAGLVCISRTGSTRFAYAVGPRRRRRLLKLPSSTRPPVRLALQILRLGAVSRLEEAAGALLRAGRACCIL